MKVTNLFKVIIIACLVIAFTVSVISCEKPPVVVEEVEEEKAEEIIVPEEAVEETRETLPETTTEIAADMKRVDDIIDGKTGEKLGEVFAGNISLGKTLGIVKNSSFLDETNNKDYDVFDNPGEYQLSIFLIGRDRKISGIDRLLEVGNDNNKRKIFILPNETAHEQGN